MLEMTCFGNAITIRHNNTLAFQPVGACIASPLCRRYFLSECILKEPLRLAMNGKPSPGSNVNNLRISGTIHKHQTLYSCKLRIDK